MRVLKTTIISIYFFARSFQECFLGSSTFTRNEIREFLDIMLNKIRLKYQKLSLSELGVSFTIIVVVVFVVYFFICVSGLVEFSWVFSSFFCDSLYSFLCHIVCRRYLDFSPYFKNLVCY